MISDASSARRDVAVIVKNVHGRTTNRLAMISGWPNAATGPLVYFRRTGLILSEPSKRRTMVARRFWIQAKR